MKFSFRTLKLMGMALISLSISSNVQAGIVIYTDAASFQSVLGSGSYLETFGTLTPDTHYASPLAFSSNGFSYNVVGNATDGLTSGNPGLVLLGNIDAGGPTSVDITGKTVTALSMNAFSTDASHNPDSGPITITVNGIVTLVLPTSSASTFYGVTDTDPITSVSVMTPNSNEYTAIANLTVGTVAVPEPSSVLLFGLGSIGACFGIRRRRTVA